MYGDRIQPPEAEHVFHPAEQTAMVLALHPFQTLLKQISVSSLTVSVLFRFNKSEDFAKQKHNMVRLVAMRRRRGARPRRLAKLAISPTTLRRAGMDLDTLAVEVTGPSTTPSTMPRPSLNVLFAPGHMLKHVIHRIYPPVDKLCGQDPPARHEAPDTMAGVELGRG